MFKDIISKKENIYKNRNKIKDISIDIALTQNSFLKILDFDGKIVDLALKSKEITEKYFGKVILLYAPLYISNYCINGCLYCGFSALNKMKREKLSLKEIEKEMISLKEKNFDTILILTGEDPIKTPVSYIKQAVKLARKYFSEVLIEVYPLKTDEYKLLVDNGLTGVTLYQETYNKKLYEKLHKFGPKKDFYYRLDAIERAINAGVKEVNIGPLLGLNSDFNFEVFMVNEHAKYIMENYPDVEVSISFPRIRSSVSRVKTYKISDKDFVKSIILTRLYLPRVSINLSTRENSFMRDNLIGLGITKMSAESKTSVGGYYSNKKNEKQFEIYDNRTVKEIIKVITEKGHRAEFTNWVKT